MSDLSGRLSGSQAISGSLSGGSVLRGGLSMGGGVSPGLLLDKADVITDTASGSIVSIPDGMASPVLDLSVGIEPIQDLHGYDNPWPAGGGKNLFNKDAVEMDKWIDVNATTISPSTGYAVSDYMPVTQGETYYIGAKGSGRSAYYDSSKNGIAYFTYSGGASFVAEYTGFVRFTLYAINMSALLSTLQFEKGSTATAYAPYSNICPISGRSEVNVYLEESYDPQATPKATIQLGQTVYGGTVDVTDGKLTVDRIKKVLTESETVGGGQTGTNSTRIGVLMSDAVVDNTKLKCNIMATNANADSTDTFGICGLKDSSGNIYIFFRTPAGLANNAARLAWLVANGCEVVYPIATPTEIQLTPEEIQILQLDNNIWSDTGNTEVTYRADTKLWILKKIAQALNA